MLVIKIEKIDELFELVERLKIITFLQNLTVNEQIDEDFYFKNLDLRAESVRYFIAEQSCDAVRDIINLITDDNFAIPVNS